jgi:DNA-binding FrmR family transcriptional regulator
MVEKKKRTGVRGNADPVLHEEHVHVHEHGHTHVHTHTQTKAVLNRMARLIGHLQSVRRMVEEGRDCSEVLIQLAAVQSALQSTGKVILQDHLKHCIVEAAQEGDTEAIDELCKAIDRYMK